MREAKHAGSPIIAVVFLGSCVRADDLYEGSLSSLRQMSSAVHSCGVWRVKIEPPEADYDRRILRLGPPVLPSEVQAHRCLSKWLEADGPKDISPVMLIGD
jgi:hypothetical protein